MRRELTLSGPACPEVADDGAAAVELIGVAEVAGAVDATGVEEAGAFDATGVALVAGVALFVFDELRATTTSAKITIPTITAITTREEDLAVAASFFFPASAESLLTLPEGET